jgi:hypothetical protein
VEEEVIFKSTFERKNIVLKRKLEKFSVSLSSEALGENK